MPLMKCGHSSNGAVTYCTNTPVCVVCVGISPGATEVDNDPPNLQGRTAKCDSCKNTKPSDVSLPFFEYRGPGSRYEVQCANCHRFHEHKEVGREGIFGPCSNYQPSTGGRETDGYYCGCQGWE